MRRKNSFLVYVIFFSLSSKIAIVLAESPKSKPYPPCSQFRSECQKNEDCDNQPHPEAEKPNTQHTCENASTMNCLDAKGEIIKYRYQYKYCDHNPDLRPTLK